MAASGNEGLRIANCSRFYGDRLSAAREMLEDGPIDFLTGDYLAELTMLILWKLKQKDDSRGYATTYLRQMKDVMGLALEKGVKIVTNAGGLNPAGLANELRAIAKDQGITANIAHIEGDDLLAKLPELQAAGHNLAHLDTGQPLAELGAHPLSANAYLGAWGIVDALEQGADIVVCPRVTDASVVVGPAAWKFGWQRDDWDRLAGAVAAGHVVECGAQCTGGNYAFFQEVPGLERPGFPIAEMYDDGSSVITKHAGTGGLVSVGTVTAQLLYEIDAPRYANPDVVARFDTVRLEQVGKDRVRMYGVQGEPATGKVKICLNYLGGFRNAMTLVLTGLDIEAKAALVKRTLLAALDGGKAADSIEFELARGDKADAPTNVEATAQLRVTVKSGNPEKIGRAFSSAVVEMALASYPGFFATTPPGDATPYGVYWPALVPADVVQPVVVLEDGTRRPTAWTEASAGAIDVRPPEIEIPGVPGGPTKRLPLGTVFGARSGDKGGNANVGLWARSAAGYAWLDANLDIDAFKKLMPEAAEMEVRRFAFPNLWAVNFVVVGLLGEGVSSSVRFDPQAKGLGEYLRSRYVDLPEALLADAPQAV